MNQLRRWLVDNCAKADNISGPGLFTWGDLDYNPPPQGSIFRQTVRLMWNLLHTPKPKKNLRPLVTPRQGHNIDGLTRWVANDFVPYWVNLKAAVAKCWRLGKEVGDEEALPTQPENEKSSKRKRWGKKFVSNHNPDTSDGAPAGSSSAAQTTSSELPVDDTKTLETYSEARMLRFTSSVATLVACLLPTVAIGALATLQSTGSLIGLIAVFTAVFAVGLMFLTDARTTRVEIFTATAA